MKEVYPDIFLIKEPGKYGFIKPSENIYILAGPDGLIYDAGYGKKKAIKSLISQIKEIEQRYKAENKEFKITRVLPSHWHPDHTSGLKLLRKYLGVKIILSKKTQEIIKNGKSFREHFEPQDIQEEMLSIRSGIRRITDKLYRFIWWRFYKRLYGLKYLEDPDEAIESECDIMINGEKWEIFPSPGHASDHISLYNKEKGILFSGDNILRTITTWLGPPECHIDEYIDSIKTIQSLSKLELILAAHGSPISNPKERIGEIIKHREERIQQVIDLVNENAKMGVSPSKIVMSLYPNGNIMMHNAARGWICLTLRLLEEKGKIKRLIEKRKIRFFPL